MQNLSPDLRRSIVELGQRSRPLGDGRAQQLAASLVLSLVQELRGQGDCARVIEHYRQLIDDETGANAVRDVPKRAPRRASWAELLPELD